MTLIIKNVNLNILNVKTIIRMLKNLKENQMFVRILFFTSLLHINIVFMIHLKNYVKLKQSLVVY